jgi:transcriptional regulator with XRE-family HTH domain
MVIRVFSTDYLRVCGNLGRNLRRVREQRELTQEDVSERSGVHATEVSRIEAGKRDPRVSTLERLANAVEVSPGELLRKP